MNAAHFHLFLTHVPVFGTLFGIFLLLFGGLRKNEELKRLGLWVLIVTGLLVLPTYLTGSPANRYVKDLMPTMPMETADQHEEIAILALVAVLFVGILSVAGVVIFQKGKIIPGWFISLMLAIALISTAALTWTANLGGKVRHTEIRAQDPLAPTSAH
jgi:hypothetical protein